MAAEILYRAKIKHTEKTIQQLYRTQYYSYDKLRILLRLALGFALVAAALVASIPTWGRAILLLFGTWFFASRDFPASVRADKALSERKAKLPGMDYAFGPDAVTVSGEGSMDIPYNKFTRLVEDKDYLYLFVTRDSVCMLERESLRPNNVLAFGKFMEEKTGLSWRREKAFLSLNIYELRQIFLDARK